MTPPPGSDGGLLNADRRQPDHDGARASLIGTPLGILAGTYLAEYGRARRLDDGRALHQRHPAERAVDRDRPVRLRGDGRADGPFLRLGRRGGAGRHRRSRWSCARPRTCCSSCPTRLREAAAALGAAALEGDPARRLPRRARRHHHRRAARGRPHQPARPRRCCSPRSTTSSGAPTSTRRWRACRS